MQSGNFTALMIIFSVIGIAVIAVIVKYFSDYASDIRNVKAEIESAKNWNSFVYWNRELRYLHFSVIPGLTPKRIRRICRRFSKPSEDNKDGGLISLMIPSVLSVLICCVCLASATYAWYTVEKQPMNSIIQSANYNISAEVYDTESGSVLTPLENEYSLYGGKTYKVTVTASGNAENGYCTVSSGGKIYYTNNISPGERFIFYITPDTATKYKINGHLGTHGEVDGLFMIYSENNHNLPGDIVFSSATPDET